MDLSQVTKLGRGMVVAAVATVVVACAPFPERGEKPWPERVSDMEKEVGKLQRQLQSREQLDMLAMSQALEEQQMRLSCGLESSGSPLSSARSRRSMSWYISRSRCCCNCS